MSNVLNYLKVVTAFAEKYGGRTGIGGYYSFEHFVLRNGAPMEGRAAVKRYGQQRECFKNAADFVLSDPHHKGRPREEIIYCEGFALSNGCPLPVIHAWACTPRGEVIDNTWKDGIEYFGIAVKRTYLASRLRHQSTYGLIDIPRDKKGHRWPILNCHPKDWRHPVMDRLQKVSL